MKKVVPSTVCDFKVMLYREADMKSETNKNSKFASIRPAINRLIVRWDEPANRVIAIQVNVHINADLDR